VRFAAARPLTALAPAWAGLAGLLASGGLQMDLQTVVRSTFVLLLVEPLLGGLWQELAPAPRTGGGAVHSAPDAPEAANPSKGDPPAVSDHAVVVLPFGRPESPASRLIGALAAGRRTMQTTGWPILLQTIFAVGVASLLGPAPVAVAAALVLLLARRRWQTGVRAYILHALYDMTLPWLIGLAALGMVAQHGAAPYRDVLALVALSTIVYGACLALAAGQRLPALLVFDAAQAAILALLLVRHETLAVWLVGMCLVSQLTAHPELLAGGDARSFLRRATPFVVAGMLAAAMALSPTLP